MKPRMKVVCCLLALSSTGALAARNHHIREASLGSSSHYSGPGYDGNIAVARERKGDRHSSRHYRRGRSHHGYVHVHRRHSDPNDWHPKTAVKITSGSGAVAWVSKRNMFNERAQGFLDELNGLGYKVSYMGGYRAGHCDDSRHKHMCGLAFDTCQTDRNVVDCDLPPNDELEAMARKYGLLSGSVWYDRDRGHFEDATIRTAWGKGPPIVFSIKKFKEQLEVKAAEIAKPPTLVAALPLPEPITVRESPIETATTIPETSAWMFSEDVIHNYQIGVGYQINHIQLAGNEL